MARRGFGSTGFSLNKAVSIVTKFTTLNVTNQLLNSIPGLPAPVKTIAGIGTAIQSYRILGDAMSSLPGPTRTLGKSLVGLYSTLLVVQQLPNLLTSLQQGFSTTPGGLTPGGTTPFLLLGP